MSPRPRDPAERVLVALDVESLTAATTLLDRLHGVLSGCKIGNQLFTAAGPAAIEAARKRGYRVFLDLKFHDIPNTVTGAVREATRLGVFMLNVHAGGGLGMMRAAAEAAARAAQEFGAKRPLCLGVTVLTSLDRRALEVELGVPSTVPAQVLHLARLCRQAGLDGCVASPREIGLLRLNLGRDWLIVTPGIRGSGAGVPAPREVAGPGAGVAPPRELGGLGGHLGAPQSNDDQVRTATAAAAIRAGADYLVVGRPITGAPDPVAAARAILEECAGT
ncbi:MAG TPA: orotidine-5'-phosphate decarboxylase [Methylomirabilota bacterium]|nr:orotidine-5'-phosphate decarboxylase [Methylomirabilota bacterium]